MWKSLFNYSFHISSTLSLADAPIFRPHVQDESARVVTRSQYGQHFRATGNYLLFVVQLYSFGFCLFVLGPIVVQ